MSPSQIKQDSEAAEKEHLQLLEVERFSMTGESLRLDYRVTNIFPHDIWVCATLNYFETEDSPHSVETRIIGEMLRIRRRANMEQNCLISAGAVHAVYHRLAPQQLRSGTVLLALPVRNASLLYATHEPFSRVVLNRVVLELGYFSEDLPTLISRRSERAKLKDPNVALVRYIMPNKWEDLPQEQSVQVTISDVAVPGVLGGPLARAMHGIKD